MLYRNIRKRGAAGKPACKTEDIRPVHPRNSLVILPWIAGTSLHFGI